MNIVERVRKALNITSNAFDDELRDARRGRSGAAGYGNVRRSPPRRPRRNKR